MARSALPIASIFEADDRVPLQQRSAPKLLRNSVTSYDFPAASEAAFETQVSLRPLRNAAATGPSDKPDHRQRRLLRACRTRQCCCGAEKREEVASADAEHGFPMRPD